MWQQVADHLWPFWPLWMIFGLTRATEVVLFDRILDKPRTWWLKRVNPNDYPQGHPDLSLLGYLSMCIFCMSLDIGLLVGVVLMIPAVRNLVPIFMSVLAASWFVPVLDHWQDKFLDDKTLTPSEVEAWSHGGAHVEVEVDTSDTEGA